MNILRTIARCFVVPCDERSAASEKIIPQRLTFRGRRLSYEREIVSSLTGEVIGYEQAGGTVIVDTEAQDREHAVRKQLSYPVFRP